MLRQVLGYLSPAGEAARLSVIILHRVLPKPDPLFPGEIDARRFEEICVWLKQWLNILPLDEAIARFKNGSLPDRAGAITFDDGYADNHDIALPILQKLGLTATFFVATGFLNGGRMWNDSVTECVRLTPLDSIPMGDLLGSEFSSVPVATLDQKRAAIQRIIAHIKYSPLAQRAALAEQVALNAKVQLPQDLMMTSMQLLAMRQAGMQIGAHTTNHPILAKLDMKSARSEIEQSKADLENLLGQRIGLFAYPNGKPHEDYSAQNVELVSQLGFDAAVCTQRGALRAGADIFQIPRFTPWDRTSLRFAARLATTLFVRPDSLAWSA
jgi:peptidoglycan/xylan/chitin deacetylase (PgdA/CDA1 family)